MVTSLHDRLRQQTFSSPFQEATLNILVCADYLQRRIEEVCNDHEITSAQYNVLRILRGVHPDGHPRCEIIGRMIQAAPDVTRLIDRLERAGLVERTRSAEDKRLSVTVITKTGLQLLKRMQPKIDAHEKEMAMYLSEAEAKTLSTLCEKIYTD
jgi:DNA-binding MarR family transcriptional regulator